MHHSVPWCRHNFWFHELGGGGETGGRGHQRVWVMLHPRGVGERRGTFHSHKMNQGQRFGTWHGLNFFQSLEISPVFHKHDVKARSDIKVTTKILKNMLLIAAGLWRAFLFKWRSRGGGWNFTPSGPLQELFLWIIKIFGPKNFLSCCCYYYPLNVVWVWGIKFSRFWHFDTGTSTRQGNKGQKQQNPFFYHLFYLIVKYLTIWITILNNKWKA